MTGNSKLKPRRQQKCTHSFEFYKENAIDIGKVTWIEEPADVDYIVLNKTEVLVIELARPKTRLNGKMLKSYGTCGQVCR